MNQDLEIENESETALEEEEIVGDLNEELKYEFDLEPDETWSRAYH